MRFERHFLSACWPEVSGDEFEHLKDSIGVSGLREAIVLFDGQILDGWNRYRACVASGVEPHFIDFDGEDPAQFVRDKHTRRSLTLTQRLACIGLMASWAPSHRPNKGELSSPLLKKELAEQAGSTERYAQKVMGVIKSGDKEAIKGMVDGKLSANAADAKVKGKTTKPKQSAAPAAKPKKYTPPTPQETGASELLESAHAIEVLSEEVEVLKDQLAVKHMEGTGEEKAQAAALITDLRSQIKTLNIELDAMRTSRDGLQRENRELMKQIAIYQRQLKQAQKA